MAANPNATMFTWREVEAHIDAAARMEKEKLQPDEHRSLEIAVHIVRAALRMFYLFGGRIRRSERA